MVEAIDFVWSEERVAMLRKLWDAGASSGAIARELGSPAPGPTRNAVIGKIHRLGLTRDVTNVAGRPRKDGVVKAPVPAKPKRESRTAAPKVDPLALKVVAPEPPPPPRRVETAAPGVTILDLRRRHCRWPVAGAGVDTAFCGELTIAREVNGLECPYCDARARMAYAPRRSDRERAADDRRRQAQLQRRRVAA